jgi:hypothetical protein
MNFPEISTDRVFSQIPKESVEAMTDFMWSDALWNQGNCRIDLKRKIGTGFVDVLLRYYNELGDKYVWLLGEYKQKYNQELQAIAQLLMYLGNFFYDTNLEGIDNLAGIFVASGEHFRLIKREKLFGIMEKFEYIWRKHFRVSPSSAYDEPEIREFVQINSHKLLEDSLLVKRSENNIRLDEVIKSIYKEWNLQ